MAYYLGRQVSVSLSTEQAGSAVTVSGAANGPYIDIVGVADTVTITNAGVYVSGTVPAITVTDGSTGGSDLALTATMATNGLSVIGATITNSGSGYRSAPTLAFAGTGGVGHANTASGTITVKRGRDAFTLFADGLNWGASGTAKVTDLTGVDLSIGAVDEDITYMGLRSITKAEIKKETTVSLTRKKSDAVWDTIYNDNWRCGVNGTSSAYANLEEPATGKGYRVYVTLVSGTEVFTLPNTYIGAHTTSLNADGTSEETMEFTTYVTPIISTSAHTGATSATNL